MNEMNDALKCMEIIRAFNNPSPLFQEGCVYERLVKDRTDTDEPPIFLCEYANINGGVLTFQNTNRKSDSIWVIQQAKNYKESHFTVEQHIKKISFERRNAFQTELSKKLDECSTLKEKIREINESLNALDAK